MITHLISTTEFVKLVILKFYNSEILNHSDTLHLIERYTYFISQKPELWMFIPVGDNGGEILEEPKMEDYNFHGVEIYHQKRREYHQAQSKILFKGWKIDNKFSSLDNDDYVEIIPNKDNWIDEYFNKYDTLESFIKNQVRLELTETALKQIL